MRISPLPRQFACCIVKLKTMTNDGYAIKVVRTLRGYSRRELARLASVPERRLISIEYGAPAAAPELRRIWEALTSDPPRVGGEQPHVGVQASE